MKTLIRNTTIALILALASFSSWAQTCQTRDEVPEPSRKAVENASQQLLDQAIRGDVAAMQTSAITSLQARFGGIAAAVTDHKAVFAGDHATIRTLFTLATGETPSPDGQFYCGVFSANGQSGTSAEFALPGLPTGKYAIVIYDLAGTEGPHALTVILQDVGGWKLAGFYIRPQSAAGHDGLWYLQRARDFKAKGQNHNAWFYYVTSWNLMAPVNFMSTKLLTTINEESSSIRPKDVPEDGGAAPFSFNGRTYKITEMSVVRGPTNFDLNIKYSVPATADSKAVLEDARNLCNAYLGQYPETREGFNNILAHAIDPSGGDVAGLVALKTFQKNLQVEVALLPAGVEAFDPAVAAWMRPVHPVAPITPTITASLPATTSLPATAGASVPAGGPAGDIPSPSGQVTKRGDGFTLRVQSEEVNLPATVVDRKQHLVTTLAQADFVVYEDGQPQKITLFRQEDVPVSIGILIDNSGSMREKRAAVSKAVVNFVKASHPQDEVFVVNFNDWPYLDQDFTSDVDLLRKALDQMDSRGSTALYDAVVAAAEHLAGHARRGKKILLVVTDGQDNFSRASLEDAISSAQKDKDNGPTIYSIGIMGSGEKEKQARRALEALSFQTGGVAYFPESLTEVNAVTLEVAHDIRNQYSITYKPSNPQARGGYRRVKVVARSAGHSDLQVRTRSGYTARGREAASK